MAKPRRQKRGYFSPEERQRRRDRMREQIREGKMVRAKSIDAMTRAEVAQYLEDTMALLTPEEQERVMAEYRPLNEDVSAPSPDVDGGALASAPDHEGPEPADPHTRDHTRSTLTSTAETDSDTSLDQQLAKLCRNVNRNFAVQRSHVIDTRDSSELDLSDDAQLERAFMSPRSPAPESRPHTTYVMLQRRRRSLLS